LQEAFGVGTAATIAPIATIGYRDQEYNLPSSGPAAFSKRVSQALDAIRTGRKTDTHGWMVSV
jgi:branched-chain amino acid aminotransferase